MRRVYMACGTILGTALALGNIGGPGVQRQLWAQDESSVGEASAEDRPTGEETSPAADQDDSESRLASLRERLNRWEAQEQLRRARQRGAEAEFRAEVEALRREIARLSGRATPPPRGDRPGLADRDQRPRPDADRPDRPGRRDGADRREGRPRGDFPRFGRSDFRGPEGFGRGGRGRADRPEAFRGRGPEAGWRRAPGQADRLGPPRGFGRGYGPAGPGPGRGAQAGEMRQVVRRLGQLERQISELRELVEKLVEQQQGEAGDRGESDL